MGFEHQQLAQASTSAAHLQAGSQHPGVIDHQQIARLKLLEQIPHLPVTAAGFGLHHQQPSGMARLDRPLGDAGLRQLVVVGAQQRIARIGQHQLKGMDPS